MRDDASVGRGKGERIVGFFLGGCKPHQMVRSGACWTYVCAVIEWGWLGDNVCCGKGIDNGGVGTKFAKRVVGDDIFFWRPHNFTHYHSKKQSLIV